VNVLGVNWGVHDSSASLFKGNVLVAAAQEERFIRKKYFGWIPVNAIKYCLTQGKIELQDLDTIVVAGISSYQKIPRIMKQNFLSFLSKILVTGSSLSDILKLRKTELVFVEHHLAHAASAYYFSGFTNASVITIDGEGDHRSTVSWHATSGSLQELKSKPSFNSLGLFHAIITIYLGFGPNGDGITMGLSQSGNRNLELQYLLDKAIRTENYENWYDLNVIDDSVRRIIEREFLSKVPQIFNSPSETKKLIEKFNKLVKSIFGFNFPPRTDSSVFKAPYPDLAREATEKLQQGVLNTVKDTVEKTGEKRVCLAGGVALNCLINKFVKKEDFVQDLFVFPAAGDFGLAVGAAAHFLSEKGFDLRKKLDNVYLGPEYSNVEIENALRKHEVSFEETSDVSGYAADLISSGKIIGWFQGRMELGPRALGNRSILADPTKKGINLKVNKVKGREYWRPLAPSMTFESRKIFLEDGSEYPFMAIAVDVKNDIVDEIPSVVHVDKTTRPQTVKKEINDRYWKLIKELGNKNGLPIVLNTSFNLRGQPIVCSPDDAIQTFIDSDLDALVMGDFVVEK